MNESKQEHWSEQWTLASGGSGATAITGPSLYGEQTVEVVPRLEAEQAIDRVRADERKRLEEGLLSDDMIEVLARDMYLYADELEEAGWPEWDDLPPANRDGWLPGAKRHLSALQAAIASLSSNSETEGAGNE